MLIVFVKNKLLSTDTIMPLILELKHCRGVSTRLVVTTCLTYKLIVNNKALYDAINESGKIIYLGNGVENSAIRKIISIFQLCVIFLQGLLGAKFIHFSALNYWPFKILGVFFHKRVFFSYGNIYNHRIEIINNRLKGNNNNNNIDMVGDNIIVYTDRDNNKTQGIKKNIYNFGETRTRKVWRDFVKVNSQKHYNTYTSNLDQNKGFIVFILGSVSNAHVFNKGDDEVLDLFNKTMYILSTEMNGYNILVKPHPVESQGKSLSFIKGQLNKFGNNFSITSLHPTVLSLNATLFISNAFSTTLGDAYRMGVPTIEFSDYNKKTLDLIKESNTDDLLVDHFINNDEVYLRKILSSYKGKNTRVHYMSDIIDDHSGLLDKLS